MNLPQQFLKNTSILTNKFNISGVGVFLMKSTFTVLIQTEDRGLNEIIELNSVSHLIVHVVNRLLPENRKSIPNYLMLKTLFKNETLQILNFIPVRNKKIFPYGAMLMLCLFSLH